MKSMATAHLKTLIIFRVDLLQSKTDSFPFPVVLLNGSPTPVFSVYSIITLEYKLCLHIKLFLHLYSTPHAFT